MARTIIKIIKFQKFQIPKKRPFLKSTLILAFLEHFSKTPKKLEYWNKWNKMKQDNKIL
jgi:hypothetical protein